MEQESTVQKIAMTVWGGRISPVFDSARTLLIAEIVDKDIVSLTFREFDPNRPMQLVQLLRTQNIMVLICGAVSEGPANTIESAGFELIPFIAGSVKDVVETFLLGNPAWTELTMPGYDRNACRNNMHRQEKRSAGRSLGRAGNVKVRRRNAGAEKIKGGKNGRAAAASTGLPVVRRRTKTAAKD